MSTAEELQQLKAENNAPEWLTEESYRMLRGTYLLQGETPRDMWQRVSNSSAKHLGKMELASKFFDLMWNNWLGLASPVAANTGTTRGLPISCFSLAVPDSIDGIMSSMHELAAMTKNGGGVGVHWSGVRPQGATIRGNGKSEGVVPFIKIQDSTTIGVSQGGVRRGASAAYLPVDHGDFWQFIRMRRPEGDQNRQCLNTHHGICITDDFIERAKAGDKEAREKWSEILKARMETGEPYLFFSDNVARNRPDCYKERNLDVKGSNICTEIFLHTDDDHSFVCCLSSMNLARWDEWKNTDAVKLATWFLDGILIEFIAKASNINGFERAVRSAEKEELLVLELWVFTHIFKNI